jgi:cyclic pyranopterin phosphate synthase
MSGFSHLDKTGKPNMVNINEKKASSRIAKAAATIYLPKEVMSEFIDDDIKSKKGSVFHTAILAGIMGAKKTSDLIPLCHPLPLEDCKIDIDVINDSELVITAETIVNAKTGVEMEALTAVSIAALTVYDMCKALSHNILIKEIKLLSKSGGKSDFNRDQ